METLFTANKPHRGSDLSREDSSSVTSKSSGNVSGKCGICGGTESLLSQPFVECSSCRKKRDHAHCLKVDLRTLPRDWKCKRCRRKETDAPSGPSLVVPLNFHQPANQIRRNCKEPGCMKPIFQSDSALCHTHQIQQRHKKAAAIKPVPGLVASRLKPIKKKALYNIKSTSELKGLKRKRSSGDKRSADHEDSELLAASSSKVATPQERSPSQGKTSTSIFSAKTTPMRTSQQRTAQFNLLAGMGSGRSLMDGDMNFSIGSASIVELPISLLNADLEADSFTPHSARRTPQTHVTTSPEYSPPPPELPVAQATISPDYSPPPPGEVPPNETDASLAGSDLGVDDSPGSQIHQEMRATVDQFESPKVHGVVESPAKQLVPVFTDPTSVPKGKEQGYSHQPAEADNIARASDQEDHSMSDAPIIPKNLETEFPAITSACEYIISAAGDQDKLEEKTAIEFVVPEVTESLEARRKQRAATFDTSELDSFLSKQAEPESEMQPTSQELADTQIWGHINPTVVWPKEMSEEWLVEKRLEIDARGGRKANYGKLLTAQVRKERAEKGWNIHQNSEMGSDKKWAETARHMEELFGIKNIDGLIPGQRNGQLVMMEPPLDENGKKRKKPKVYPVF